MRGSFLFSNPSPEEMGAGPGVFWRVQTLTVAQAGLKPLMILLQPLWCWDSSCVAPIGFGPELPADSCYGW